MHLRCRYYTYRFPLDQTNIENTDPGKMLIPDNKELIERFCQYLEKEDETIYPDIIAPDGRITPH